MKENTLMHRYDVVVIPRKILEIVKNLPGNGKIFLNSVGIPEDATGIKTILTSSSMASLMKIRDNLLHFKKEGEKIKIIERKGVCECCANTGKFLCKHLGESVKTETKIHHLSFLEKNQ